MVNPKTGKEYPANPQRTWAVTKETFEQYYNEGKIVFPDDYPFLSLSKPSFRYWKDDDEKKAGKRFGLISASTKLPDTIGMSLDGTREITNLFEGKLFSYPKPTSLVKYLINISTKLDSDAVILDFFSGSATTAHAVMQLNAEDGGHRKFIMVQLPEACDEKSEAYKAGYKTICDIGKERIRRAGAKIEAELAAKSAPADSEQLSLTDDQQSAQTPKLDTGFRVFKLADSNMRDVYFAPDDYTQDMLSMMESNIKPDRTALDLLFGCLLEWGLPLSMPYRSETINGCTVHTYNDGDLIACFDEKIPATVIEAIARRQPLRAVFRDAGFTTSPEKINLTEVFKLLAPDTRVKVI